MNIYVIRGRDLSAKQSQAWLEIQQANRQFASAFFSPHFTQAVAAVRDDTFVGVIENHGQALGFFPFQRGRLRIGKPVGGALSDYQAVITAKGVAWTPEQLLAGCGLDIWNFHHLLACQEPFFPYHHTVDLSPTIDLSKGFSAYAQKRQKGRPKPFARENTKRRKLEREHGTLRFEAHTGDAAVFRQLLRWKSNQYTRTGLVDIFSFRWIVKLLDRIRRTQEEEFAGMLSALWAGERLVAAHMGMRSRTVWHWWFPAYDPNFATFSPGLILLLKMAQAAASLGVGIIDLGKGISRYKLRLKTGAVTVAEGRVTLPSLAASVSMFCDQTAAWIRKTPLVIAARIPSRFIRRAQRWNRFR